MSAPILPTDVAPVFSGATILLLAALLIVLGTLAGNVARRFKLPSLTGQIIMGLLLGESLLNLIPSAQQKQFDPLITFAVGLVAVSIGGHLDFRRLRNAVKRILWVCVCQVLATFVVVFFAFQIFNPFQLSPEQLLPVHLIIAAIATSTSPVSTLHIIKEQRARGLLVKTTIAVIAVNNLLTLLIFAVCRSVAGGLMEGSFGGFSSILPSVIAILVSSLIGVLTGLVLVKVLGKGAARDSDKGDSDRSHDSARLFTALLVGISMAAGLCEYLSQLLHAQGIQPSPILACLALGLVLANRASFKEEALGLFDVLENAIFTLFFVLAGAHFDVHAALMIMPAAGLYILARIAGKVNGGFIGARISHSLPKMGRYVGPALLAQGAIAIALIVIIEKDPVFADIEGMLTACVLTGVVVFELLAGPVLAWALKNTNEANQDKTRLIEFLQEEFILPSVYAKDKESLIEELAYFLLRAHRIDMPVEELVAALHERESEVSTALGRGIAVPHAKVDYGEDICGVLALVDPPLDFGAEDGVPVRLVVMIMTPHNKAEKHLEVIGSVARIMHREQTREALFNARTAEEIHDIVYSEEHDHYNYIVES
jgi:PTS system fructose-specific IIC component